MNIAVGLGGEIYETDNPLSLKKELVGKLDESVQKERTKFLKKCTAWLDGLREVGEL